MNLNPFENEMSLKLNDETDADGYFRTCEYDYYELIKSITDKVNWKVNAGTNDYQGDYLCFGEGQGKYYFVDFGYGSCSGCDALEACNSFQDLLEVREDIKRNIKEFESLDQFEKWFNNEGQTEWWNWDDIKAFIKEMDSIYGLKLIWRD